MRGVSGPTLESARRSPWGARLGVCLGLAGCLIQRMTGNVMASPELLGISGGAALVMVLIVLTGTEIGRVGQLAAATLGAAGALGLLILWAVACVDDWLAAREQQD